MSDLPTREEVTNRFRWSTPLPTNADKVLDAYANGALLTREEAANDPEVREAVMLYADLDAAADMMTQLTAEDLPAVTWHRAASRAVLRAALGVTDDE